MRRVLILGGTGWLGRRIAAAALASGAQVVCLARGESGTAPDGVQLLRADRSQPGAYEALEGAEFTGDWDEVIELAYEPALVGSALTALAGRSRHWTLISSISAARAAIPQDPDGELDYAQAKLAAEHASAELLGDKLLIIRPGLIAGPGDPSDRFGYWMARLDRGGPALTPLTAGRKVQVIDVDDLTEFTITAGRDQCTGMIDAVGHSHRFADVLAQAVSACGFTDEFLARDDDWLLAHDVRYWAGPRSLPLWLPVSDTDFVQHGAEAYLAAGGAVRPLDETIVRVLADERERGIDRERRSGLTAAQEQRLTSIGWPGE